MRLVLRVLFLLLLPFRFLRWIYRRLFLLVHGYTVLEIHLHGRLRDRPAPFSMFAAWGSEPPGPSLLEVLLALDRARRDPRLRAVFVELGPLRAGLARAEEVRIALEKVKEAGKHVTVYIAEGGLAEYAVALGASEILMPESGALHVTGVASEIVLLKGLLDRVGLKAWLGARGKYKTAREMFVEPEMTAENREMTAWLTGDLQEQLVLAIARSRKLPADVVREHLDSGPFVAPLARKLGLVDALSYRDDAKDRLEALVVRYRPVTLSSYLTLSERAFGGRPRATVALLDVSGHIKSGGSVPGADGPRATGSRRFVRDVGLAADDPRVDAIVLRVDSPGGSALASDLMWHALDVASRKKPIVVSLSDVAASGGYFVAGIKGARILASEATLTGSIGVLAGKFDATELYAKLGLKKEIVGPGRRAGFFSEARGFTKEEVQKLEEELDAHYEHFLRRMAEGREKTVEEMRAVAEGRVFTGRQALAKGLVDEHGGLLAAFARVRAVLALDPEARLAVTSSPPERRSFPLRLAFRNPESWLPESLAMPLRFSEWFGRERAFALLPFEFKVF